MEESTEGVDWHRDGADLPGWAVAGLIAWVAVPVLLALALIAGLGR
jgi:hypothetical protein